MSSSESDSSSGTKAEEKGSQEIIEPIQPKKKAVAKTEEKVKQEIIKPIKPEMKEIIEQPKKEGMPAFVVAAEEQVRDVIEGVLRVVTKTAEDVKKEAKKTMKPWPKWRKRPLETGSALLPVKRGRPTKEEAAAKRVMSPPRLPIEKSKEIVIERDACSAGPLIVVYVTNNE